jgi:hypothetical protein
MSIHIATTKHSGDHIKNIIYLTKTPARFNTLSKIEKVENIILKVLDDLTRAEILHKLKNISCERFFFFQEDSIYNCCLAKKLKDKNNTIICLGPDGYKPYAVYKKKHEYLSMLRNTLEDYKELFQNKIFPSFLQLSWRYRYATSALIDEIYLTHPESLHKQNNAGHAEIAKIPEFSEATLINAGMIFNAADFNFPIFDSSIYYFNQPIHPQLEDVEFDFLKNLIAHFPNKAIYIKLHPLTTNDMKEKYLGLKQTELLDIKVPAELFILNLKNSVLLSGWSSVLITQNSSCNYYFNLPIYKNKGSKATDQSDLTILPHIKLISSPQEIEFPS